MPLCPVSFTLPERMPCKPSKHHATITILPARNQQKAIPMETRRSTMDRMISLINSAAAILDHYKFKRERIDRLIVNHRNNVADRVHALNLSPEMIELLEYYGSGYDAIVRELEGDFPFAALETISGERAYLKANYRRNVSARNYMRKSRARREHIPGEYIELDTPHDPNLADLDKPIRPTFTPQEPEEYEPLLPKKSVFYDDEGAARRVAERNRGRPANKPIFTSDGDRIIYDDQWNPIGVE